LRAPQRRLAVGGLRRGRARERLLPQRRAALRRARALTRRSGRRDRATRDVAVLLLTERFVDLLQRERVRYDLLVGIPRARADHEIERALEVLGLVVHHAEEAPVAEDERRRVDRRLPARVDV